MNNNLGISPRVLKQDGTVFSIMFYECEKDIDSNCLMLIEKLFAIYGEVPTEGIAHSSSINTNGAFNRVKKRLEKVLAIKHDEFSLRVRSKIVNESNEFFPSDLECCVSRSLNNKIKGVFSVRDTLVKGLEELNARAELELLSYFGSFYGGSWYFPANFGPEYYLSSVLTVPPGEKLMDNDLYGDRITRWRDNIWHNKLKARCGYFREIYPINYIFDSHLSITFRGRPLKEFMEKNGRLIGLEPTSFFYKWEVNNSSLDEVRVSMEDSGLILSSITKPLILK